jgi:excinuclease ABC subunit C
MIGPGDEVLYVGKSIRVRSRLLSYFRADRGEKAAEIIAHTHRIDWEYVPSEFAALLLEMRSIQRWRPPFNVEHKRDRAFCFVKLTREAAPRLLVVREVLDDGATYFGPFRGVHRVREVVREVRDLLELRDCAAATNMRFADQLDLFGADPQPLCMRADVASAWARAPAAARSRSTDAQVELARRFLDGDADMPLTILRQRMASAADRLHFEYAAELRDRMHRLEDARAELVALRGFIESLSFVYEVPAPTARTASTWCGAAASGRKRPRPRRGGTGGVRRAGGAAAAASESLPGVPTQAAEILLLARWFRLRPLELQRTWRPTDAAHHAACRCCSGLQFDVTDGRRAARLPASAPPRPASG